MSLTKREALEKHKELWLKVAEMTREQSNCVRKAEALEALGYDPDEINSQCFCCEYAVNAAKERDSDDTCAFCPVKWPGSITGTCTASLFGRWRNALDINDAAKAADFAEKIAHLADKPLKELDKMEKKFTKSDLHTGDVIVCRNGHTYVVMLNCEEPSSDSANRLLGIADTSGWERLSTFNEDLTCKETDMPEFDVMEVRRPGSVTVCPWENKEREMCTVFVREEVKELTVAEISKLLGYDVKVVK